MAQAMSKQRSEGSTSYTCVVRALGVWLPLIVTVFFYHYPQHLLIHISTYHSEQLCYVQENHRE